MTKLVIHKDWEDEYHRLKVKFEDLKLLCNQQEDQIKKLQAKNRKLESNLSQAGITRAIIKSQDVEQNQYNEDMRDQVSKLKTSHTTLKEKYKQVQEQNTKKDKEISILKRLLAESKKVGKLKRDANLALQEIEIKPAPTQSKFIRNTNFMNTSTSTNTNTSTNEIEIIHVIEKPETVIEKTVTTSNTTTTDENVLEIARKYKARLAITEEQLSQLREELSQLREIHSRCSPVDKTDYESQLRDSNWRLQQLQTQYDYLLSKSSSQAISYQRAEETMEEYSQKIRELRRLLEDLKHEKEVSDTKALRVSELEELVNELQTINKNLEHRITTLCETPFINDAFTVQEMQLKYEQLIHENDEQKIKINHLQEAVKTHFSALTSLKQQCTQLKTEKEEYSRLIEEYKLKYQDLETGHTLLENQLKMFCGEDGIDMESLERALTIVRRRGETLKKLPFLEEVETESLLTIPDLKKKIQELQILNMRQAEDNERLENMLKLQNDINKDLHIEMEAIIQKMDKDKKELIQRAADFEEMALKRLEKIQSLEAQLRQYIYDVQKKDKKIDSRKGQKKGQLSHKLTNNDIDDNNILDTTHNGLLLDLIEEKNGDLKPDENMIEIWIKNAVIKQGVIPPGASTFVVIDFFDYESQTTPLLTGSQPSWDFGASYKVIVDDFLLRYLAVDSVILELNMTMHGDFVMLARCTFPIAGLLRSKPSVKLTNYPLVSISTGEIIAHINVDVRLALPISELYQLFLQRHPMEKAYIEDISKKSAINNASQIQMLQQDPTNNSTNIPTNYLMNPETEDSSRLYNELEITILQANNLPLNNKNQPPTTYAVFQFLGNPEKFTNPVPDSCSPKYDESFVFPVITDDTILRLLQRTKLYIMIIDMTASDESPSIPSKGLIGETSIALNQLTEGIDIMNDTYKLLSKHDDVVSQLKVNIRWKHTFKKKRDLGPLALSAMDVEHLISAFIADDSNGNEVGGLVDYRAFCRFADPPDDARTAINRILAFCSQIQLRDNLSPKDVFVTLFGTVNDINLEHFMQRMLSTQIDVTPIELNQLYKYIDLDEDNTITITQFLSVINIDELNGIKGVLQEKIRNRIKDLKSRHIFIRNIFQEIDNWGVYGTVTRIEFKTILQRIGFQLVDEPDPHSHPPYIHDGNNNVHNLDMSENMDNFMGKETDLLNDTQTSDQMLHPIGSDDVTSKKTSYKNSSKSNPNLGLNMSKKDSQKTNSKQTFDMQRDELLRQSQQALQQIKSQQQTVENKGKTQIRTNIGINMLDRKDEDDNDLHDDNQEVMYSQVDNRTRNARIPQDNYIYNSDTGGGGNRNAPNIDNHTNIRQLRQRDLGGDQMEDDNDNNNISSSSSMIYDPFHSTVQSNATTLPLNYDPSIQDNMVTKVQSAYRGYQTRENLTPNRQSSTTTTTTTMNQRPLYPNREDVIAHHNDYDHGTTTSAGPVDILSAEDKIRESFELLQGKQPLPDLYSKFQVVDAANSGYITRTQFAHVIRQCPEIHLFGLELRACMDYFDESSDGSRINYEAFCRFAKYQGPVIIPPIQNLFKIVMTTRSIFQFREYDMLGNGYLKRSDMLELLDHMGYGYISQQNMLQTLQIFETNNDSLVNYSNFIEFIKENGLSVAVTDLSSALYQVLTEMDPNDMGTRLTIDIKQNSTLSDKIIRSWFKRIDNDLKGVFRYEQFHNFLLLLGLNYHKDVSQAVYHTMDVEGLGVRLNNFASWIKTYPSAEKETATLYRTLSLREIQHKVHTYLLYIHESKDTNYEEITSSFMIYDWKSPNSGCITTSQFYRALQRAGFPLTAQECRILQTEFLEHVGSERKVSYVRFFTWATPRLDNIPSLLPTTTTTTMKNVTDSKYNMKDPNTTTRMMTSTRSSLHQNERGNNNSTTTTTTATTNPYDGKEQEGSDIYTVGALLQFLEKSMKQGLDLLSIFGKFDTLSVGRITIDEFLGGLSDIGLSVIPRKTVQELGTRMKCSVGEYILYRRLIREILQELDIHTQAHELDALDILKSALLRSKVDLKQLKHVFESYDKKESGKVKEQDLKFIFEDANVQITRSEIDTLLETYNSDADSRFYYITLLSDLDKRIKNERNPAAGKHRKHLPEELSLKCREWIQSLILQGIDFRYEFDQYDEKYEGCILQSDFRILIETKLHGTFTTSEIERMEMVYRDVKDPRKVNFIRFLHGIHPRHFHSSSLASSFSDTDMNTHSSIWYNAELLRLKIRRRCDYRTPGELHKPYRHFNRTKTSKFISIDDFGVAIRDLGIRLSIEQERELFKYFITTTPSTTYFTYSDFVTFVRDPLFDDVLWKFRRTMARVRVSEQELESSLKDYDKDDMGSITYKQFTKVLITHCHMDLSTSDIQRIITKFDLDETQKVDIIMFMNFVNGFNSNNLTMNTNATTQEMIYRKNDYPRSKDAIDNVLLNTLRDKVIHELNDGFTKHEVFHYFDSDFTGVINITSLMLGCREIGLNLSQAECRNVLRQMVKMIDGGPIDINSFYQVLDIDPDNIDSSQRGGTRTPQSQSQSQSHGNTRNDGGRRRVPSSDMNTPLDDYGSNNRHYNNDENGDDEDINTDRQNHTRDIINRRLMYSSSDENLHHNKDREYPELIKSIRRDILHNCEKYNKRTRYGHFLSPREYVEDSLEHLGYRLNSDVTTMEIQKILKHFDVNINTKEIQTLLKEFPMIDHNNTENLISIRTFLDQIFPSHISHDNDDSGDDDDDDDKRPVSGNSSRKVTKYNTGKMGQLYLQRPDIVREIIENIRYITRNSSRSIDDLYREMRRVDVDSTGFISSHEFIKILTAFGFTWNDASTSDIILKILHTQDTGRSSSKKQMSQVQYEDFIESLRELLQKDEKDDEEWFHLQQIIKSQLKIMNSDSITYSELITLFELLDKQGRGEIDTESFKQCINKLGLRLTPEHYTLIFNKFTNHTTHMVKFRDFVKGLKATDSKQIQKRPHISNKTQQIITDILEVICIKLIDKYGTPLNGIKELKRYCNEMDISHPTSSGYLNHYEFKKTLEQCKVQLNPSDYKELIQYYDFNDRDRITYNDVLEDLHRIKLNT